jgi:uncharacterized protein YukE
VGGDIWGLQTLAEQCDAVAPEITGADTALSNAVGKVVTAGSWQGKTADSFSSRWDTDSRAGNQLAEAWTEIGKVIGELAAYLAGLENKLEGAAYQLEKQGVAVDQSDGAVLPDVTPGGHSNVAPQRMATAAKLASEYASSRSQILDAAQTARTTTAAQLTQIAGQLVPNAKDWGQLSNDLDIARSLWGIPTEYRGYVEEELEGTEQSLEQTERSALKTVIELRKTQGNNALLPKEMRDTISEIQADKATLESKLGFAAGLESTSSKVANGDPGALGSAADGTSGLVRVAGGAIQAIPFIGAAAGTGITIWQDLENGESMGRATEDGVDSNAASLIGGMAAAAGTEFVVGTMIGAAPEVAVAAGVVVGGVAAVGVGDFVHNLYQENWTADVHQYGVLGGVGHGVADSFDTTRHDMAHYADDIKSLF